MDFPKVSIIIPVRNEEKFIEKAIRSIIQNDYPKDKLEIIVIDGLSEDNTIEILKKLKEEYPDIIKILNNPQKITPVALNIGLKNASGDIIIRMDAHSKYPNDYIAKCVKHLTETNADNVGGVAKIIPRSENAKAIAIARVLSSPIGTGGAKYRTFPKKPIEVDTVPFGCFKRETFSKYGTFNEKLVRNQDIEFNNRIKRNGGKILLFPDISLEYYARDTFKALWKNNFSNGYWVINALKYAHLPFRLRHLIPLIFVLFLIFGLIISILYKSILNIYLFFISMYIFTISISSLKISIKEKSLKVFLYSLLAFITLHISYGLGSLWAILTFFKK